MQRRIAQAVYAAGGGKPHEFEQFWPLPDKYKPVSRVQTKEEQAEFINKIKKHYNLR